MPARARAEQHETEPTNGSHVTWRELNLVVAPMRDDIGDLKKIAQEVKEAVQTLVAQRKAAVAAADARREERGEKKADRQFVTNVWVALAAGVLSGGMITFLVGLAH